jgi:hypothetical protein
MIDYTAPPTEDELQRVSKLHSRGITLLYLDGPNAVLTEFHVNLFSSSGWQGQEALFMRGLMTTMT